MSGFRGGMYAVSLAVVSAQGAGCGKNCGDFIYRGWELSEQCGVVYGTTGVWDQPQGRVMLQLGWLTAPARQGMNFRPEPTLSISFPDTYLSAGAEVPRNEITAQCTLRTADKDTVSVDPYVELKVRGRGFNPDMDPLDRTRYQRFSWTFACDDGEELLLYAEATDVVELEVRR